MKKLYRTSEVAEILNVHPDTLRSWIYGGRISEDELVKLPSGRYRWPEELVLRLMKQLSVRQPEQRKTVVYARESSPHQKGSLENQIQHCVEWANANGYVVHDVYKDIGSALNWHRPGLLKLFKDVFSERVERVIVAYKDRLTRFGFEFFDWTCKMHNCELIVINDIDKPRSDEIVDDFVAIIHYFAMRLYGARSYKTKKLISMVKNDENV